MKTNSGSSGRWIRGTFLIVMVIAMSGALASGLYRVIHSRNQSSASSGENSDEISQMTSYMKKVGMTTPYGWVSTCSRTIQKTSSFINKSLTCISFAQRKIPFDGKTGLQRQSRTSKSRFRSIPKSGILLGFIFSKMRVALNWLGTFPKTRDASITKEQEKCLKTVLHSFKAIRSPWREEPSLSNL